MSLDIVRAMIIITIMFGGDKVKTRIIHYLMCFMLVLCLISGTPVYATNSSESTGTTLSEDDTSSSSSESKSATVTEPETDVLTSEEQNALSTEGSYEISADRDPETNEVDSTVDEASPEVKRIAPRTAASSKQYLATEAAVEELIKGYMIDRKKTFTVSYKTKAKKKNIKNYLNSLSNRLVFKACDHTGVPNEGDYLHYHLNGFEAVATLKEDNTGYWFIEIKYTMSYFSTAAQEKKVTSKVKSILKELKIKELENDYLKIKAIYDYLTKNVKYDDTHQSDSYLLKYTAYAALVNNSAVCQGYSNSFYRLALAAGIDARLIAGLGHGESHSWNIVKINGVYYNLDATWDTDAWSEGPTPRYSYFLLNTKHFKNHKRTSDYSASSFTSKYTMSKLDYVDQTANPITSLALSQGYLSLGYGESTMLYATAEPIAKANLDNLQWISDNIDVATVKDGKVKAKAVGKATIMAYVGNVYAECKVTVEEKEVTEADISPKTIKKKYTGKTIHPDISIKIGKKDLKLNKDYTITYPANSIECGTYTMSISFRGNYKGMLKYDYQIVPGQITLTSLKSASKNELTAKWKKAAKASGYQIKIAENKSFDDAEQIYAGKKTSKTIKDLKSKKVYYVKIRAYKTVNHKKYYSKWSKVLKMKVK